MTAPQAVAVVLEALGTHRCVVIEGPAGIGKSTVMRGVCDALRDHGRDVLVAAASETARLYPFGAFATIIEVNAQGDAAQRLASSMRWLSRSPSSLLFVDDAHLLDDESATFLHAVASNAVVSVCAAVRQGEELPDAVRRGLFGGVSHEIAIVSLSFDEAAAIIAAELDGIVERATEQELVAAGGGNPLLLLQAVRDARHSGVLIVRKGVWTAQGSVGSPSLRERFGAMHDLWTEGEDTLACHLAVLGQIPRGFAERLCGVFALRGALAAGWVVERGLDLTLCHGLLAEVVRDRLSNETRTDLLRSAVDRADDTGFSDAPLLSVASWLMALGDLNPSLQPKLVAAAERLRIGGQAAVALPIAERAMRLRPDHEARRVVISCRAQIGRPLPIEDPDGVVANAFGAVRGFAIGLDVPIDQIIDDALSVATNAEQRADLTLDARLIDLVRQSDVEPSLSEGMRIVVEGIARVALPEALQVLGDVLIDVGRSPEVASFAASLRSPDLYDNPYFRAFSGVLCAQASLDDGHPDDADAAIAEHLVGQSWSTDFLSECQLMFYRATVALAAGNPRSAAADLATFLERIGPMDPAGDGTMARSLLNFALAWSGMSVDLQPWASMLPPAGRWRTGRAELVRCQTLVVHGRRDEARAAALELAQRSKGQGRLRTSIEALHLATRIHADASVAESLRVIATEVTTSAGDLAARHAGALVDGDGAALLAISEEFEKRRQLSVALEVANDAVRFLRRSDDAERARNRIERLSALGTHALVVRQYAVSGRPASMLDGFGLTKRERTVAEFVAQGASNAEIGKLLGVSTRTAESHVQNIYRKLGVTSRGQLRDRTSSDEVL